MLVLDDEGYSNNLVNSASDVFQIQTEFLFLLLPGMISHFEIKKTRKSGKRKSQNLPVQSVLFATAVIFNKNFLKSSYIEFLA